MAHPTLRQTAAQLDAEVLLGDDDSLSAEVAGVKVATQTPPVRSGRRVVFLTLDDLLLRDRDGGAVAADGHHRAVRVGRERRNPGLRVVDRHVLDLPRAQCGRLFGVGHVHVLLRLGLAEPVCLGAQVRLQDLGSAVQEYRDMGWTVEYETDPLRLIVS